MPTRNYQGFQITQGTRGPRPTGGSPVAVSSNIPEVRVSSAGQALMGIMEMGSKLADQNLADETESAYLEGARQRSLGKAVNEMEGDVFSRPFQRGGYAAQDYRINQAKFAQELQSFVDRDGRTLSPEEFAKVLGEGSEQIVQSIGRGMSRKDRAAALASQAQVEQSLIQHHAKSHAAYGLEQVGQRYTVQGNQLNAALTAAREAGDTDGYLQQAGRAALYLQDVLTGDSLPVEMRDQVAVGYIRSLLSNDHADLVEQAIGSGALDGISHDDRIKIDEALRASRSRTQHRDALAYLEGNAQFHERVANGQATIGEVRGFVEREVVGDRMTANQAESVYRAFYKSASDHSTRAAIFEALEAGDINRLHTLGTTPGEAVLMLDQTMALNEYPLEVRTARGIQLGMQLGEVPRQLGQRVADTVNAVAANPDTINPSQVQLLNGVLAEVAQNSVTNPAAAQRLLNAIPDKERAVVSYAIRAAEQGIAPVDAIRTATANQEAFKEMQHFRQQRLGNEFREDVSKKLNSEFGHRWWQKAVSFATGQARPTEDLWTRGQFQLTVGEEVRRLADNPDNLALFVNDDKGPESLIELAISNVQARTLPISQQGRFGNEPESYLILPRGVSPEMIFGDAPIDFVSQALASMYPAETKEHTSSFRIYDGRLQNIQVNEAGQVELIRDVPLETITGQANSRMEEIIREERFANFGGGYSMIPGPSGRQVKFETHGGNTAGVRNHDAYGWRKRLLRDAPPPVGEVPAVSEELFMRESDEALRAVVGVAREANYRAGSAGHLEMARAAYLVGPAEFRGYAAVHQAIAERDGAALSEALRGTAWYKNDPGGAEEFRRRMHRIMAPGLVLPEPNLMLTE